MAQFNDLDIAVGGVTIIGAGAGQTTIIGQFANHHADTRLFDLMPGSHLTLDGVTLSDGKAIGAPGGAIRSISAELLLNQVTVANNSAAPNNGGISAISSNVKISDSNINSNVGGGINASSSELQVTRSSISGNMGAGLNLYFSNTDISESLISTNAGSGVSSNNVGALRIHETTIHDNESRGINISGIFQGDLGLLIESSTISGNRSAMNGAGLYLSSNSVGSVMIENSTFSGNTAVGNGGAIMMTDSVFNPVAPRLRHVTVAGNRGDSIGGIVNANNTPMIVANSIIANNLNAINSGADVFGMFVAEGINLVTQPGMVIAFTDPNTTIHSDPQLSALSSNGGLTETHLPTVTSPAINAANATFSTILDQRRFVRDTLSDLGAVELVNDGVVQGIVSFLNAAGVGVPVSLYADSNGDGLLDASDTLVSTTFTGNIGDYRFMGLLPGNYFVSTSGENRAVSLTRSDDVITTIDSFVLTEQFVETMNGNSIVDTVTAIESVGLQRTLLLESPPQAADQLRSTANQLNYSGSSGTRATVEWTRVDLLSTQLPLDLSSVPPQSAVRLAYSSDQPLTVAIQLVTEMVANNAVSEVRTTVPAAARTAELLLPLSDLVAIQSGGVDLTNVTSVRLILESSAALATTVEYVDVFSPLRGAADFNFNFNAPPTAGDDVYLVVAGTTLTTVLGVNDLLQNDNDPEQQPLLVNTTPITPPSNGTLQLNADGTFTYTSAPGFIGIDSFRYEVSDGTEFDQANVMITVNAPPTLTLQVLVNGQQTAAPGPFVATGNPFTLIYLVDGNDASGNSPTQFVNVTLVDDAGTPNNAADDFSPTFAGGDLNQDGILDENETWTFTADLVAQPGTQTHTARVGGLDSATSLALSDSSSAIYTGVVGGVAILTTTNSANADLPPGPSLLSGSGVTWSYFVSNTGTGPLANVSVVDDQAGVVPILQFGDLNLNGRLDVTEVWTYVATGIVQPGAYQNIGSVTADLLDPNGMPLGQSVMDSDPSNYFGLMPGVAIETRTNGLDADSAPGPFLFAGNVVSWTYVVTNTGNASLDGVVVSDSQPGITPVFQTGDVNADGLLDLTETWTYAATGPVLSGQQSNSGSVVATLGPTTVSDIDPSNYFGVMAGVDIETLTNGEDADFPPVQVWLRGIPSRGPID